MRYSALLLAGLPNALAQDVINNIIVPTTARVGDSTTFNADIHPGVGVTIESSLCSMELMFGESSAGGNNVADIVLFNAEQLTVAYIFPTSLVPGPYHIRMNATSNTSTSSTPENLTARSPTIQITSGSFDCANPPAFPNITSPTSSSYTSFRLESPEPGTVETVSTDGRNVGSAIVTWTYRDNKNAFGDGIDKFSIEFMLQDSKGNLASVATVPSPDPTKESLLFDFPQTGIVQGVYQLRVNYTNVFQDGVVQPGSVVTHLSEEFFIAGDQSACQGVPGKGSSGSPAGSPAGSQSGSQSGSPTTSGKPSTKTGSGSTIRPLILSTLFVLTVAIGSL